MGEAARRAPSPITLLTHSARGSYGAPGGLPGRLQIDAPVCWNSVLNWVFGAATPTWLDELGIEHTPIRDEKEPFVYSTVVFRDPDNIQLELVAVG
jgi:hypothetical protein